MIRLSAPTDSPSHLAFDPVPVRARRDGWAPGRQRAYIDVLAECGCVLEACRRVGMPGESAYRLYRRGDAASFRSAWHAAVAGSPVSGVPASAAVPACSLLGSIAALGRLAGADAAAGASTSAGRAGDANGTCRLRKLPSGRQLPAAAAAPRPKRSYSLAALVRAARAGPRSVPHSAAGPFPAAD